MVKLEDHLHGAGPKRILSLDGGGIRGVLTLGFLERMEEMLAKENNDPDFRLCNYFDLIGGTSTGSIIATGLAIGMKASEIKHKYFELGNKIFGHKTGFFQYLFKGVKYDNKPLELALKSYFGDITLGDTEKIRTGLCIFSKRAETFSTWAIHNHPEGKFYQQNKDWPLWQVVMASAAAPTYFLPMFMKDSSGEQGAFIDGGISMVNNPSFRLFLLASLNSYPFRWKLGKRNMLLVSIGTGNADNKSSYETYQKNNLMEWAAKMPDFFMFDANLANQMIMQILGDSPTSISIDSEMGDLRDDLFLGFHALTYLRYNVTFSKKEMENIGVDLNAQQLKTIPEMDNPKNLDLLSEIGEKAGEKFIAKEHFSGFLSMKAAPSQSTYFVSGSKYDLPFESYTKKDIPIGACRIDNDFEIMTMEGLMKAKKGDYLIKGVKGEFYACDAEVFRETYAKTRE
ncbi:MAG TPA: patatin-like phospholipase family protein [Saprospiraceae bacterium]|nr:patatin-like phospholipase family protein [Saprospiraceae bacterium]